MANIAYITSGKVGIHSFTHNEISELTKVHHIILCLTQLNNGPYMPECDWETIVASKSKLIIPLLKTIFSTPVLLVRLFKIAKLNGALPYLFIAFYFKEYLKRKNITSLHCQMGDYKLFIGYFLKELMQLPLTATVHAHELYQRDVYDMPQKFQALYKNCDKIITISEFNKNILIQDFGLNQERIEVMRLFPEMNRIKRISGKTKILIVANWAEKKGYRIILDAVEKLERDDFVFLVVGGTYFSVNSVNLTELVISRNLEEKIILLGRFGGPQLDVVFAASDIFCLPSITEYYSDEKPAEREGIPVALMEAMAWGKPVISTKHAGIPELVEDILIEENNVEELVSAINHLLDHPDTWKALGDRNQKIVAERYTSKNVQQLSTIFSNLTKTPQ